MTSISHERASDRCAEALLKTEEVNQITKVVNNYIKNTCFQVDELLSNYHGDIKEFALKFSKNKLFPIAIGVIRGKDKIDLIKNKILEND